MDGHCVVESTCLTFVNDEIWPVFVFPDHSAPQDFLATRARSDALPVLILGRHSFQWRSKDELLDFDPSEDYVTTDENPYTPRPRSEVERIEAFHEAREFHDINHYHHLVLEKEQTIRKRKSIFLEDESDEEETRIVPRAKNRLFSSAFKGKGLPTPSPTPRKNRKLPPKLDLTRKAEEDDSDHESLPSPSTFTPTKRTISITKPKAIVPAKLPAKTVKKPPTKGQFDYVTQKQLELVSMKKGDGKPQEEEKPKPTHDPAKVNIYVGSEEKLFILDKAIITSKYPALVKDITGDDETGYGIRTDALKNISVKLFASIVEWLETGDYKPLLAKAAGEPYLKGCKSVAQFEEAAEKSSLLWNIAHDFQLEELQQLIFRKIRAQSPLETNSLLILTRMVYWHEPTGTKIDAKMREWLRDELSRRLVDCIQHDALLLLRVLKANVELQKYVWHWNGDNPTLEQHAQMEERGIEGEDESEEEYFY